MDFVIRRQSEQIDNECDGNSSSDDQYDYKKWEWGYLRVCLSTYFLKKKIVKTNITFNIF